MIEIKLIGTPDLVKNVFFCGTCKISYNSFTQNNWEMLSLNIHVIHGRATKINHKANKTSNQDMNLRLFFYNSAFILALSLLIDNRFCYSPYKTVWWTLITTCYKELTDSFTKWSTLYHL